MNRCFKIALIIVFTSLVFGCNRTNGEVIVNNSPEIKMIESESSPIAKENLDNYRNVFESFEESLICIDKLAVTLPYDGTVLVVGMPDLRTIEPATATTDQSGSEDGFATFRRKEMDKAFKRQ